MFLIHHLFVLYVYMNVKITELTKGVTPVSIALRYGLCH